MINIQGIIISGYGKLPFAEYHFLSFQEADLAKRWLKQIIEEVTTAFRPKDANNKAVRPECALNIAFTHIGLKKLGGESISGFSQEFTEGIADEHRSRRLGDDGSSAPEKWELHDRHADAMLVIQGPSFDVRRRFSERLQELYAKHGILVIKVERGEQPADDKEHFGFKDSISQPFIENSPANPKGVQTCIRAGEFILGYSNEYDLRPATPTVKKAHDPGNILPVLPLATDQKDFGKNGSYIVFRKLYQDVPGFHNYLLANTRDKSHRELTAAKFVGRWPDGTPLVDSPVQPVLNPVKTPINDFFYMSTDADGLKCPVGAHIRRSNPRDSIADDPAQSLKTVNRHRVIRRGIQYGKKFAMPEKAEQLVDDKEDRGILFLCLNADIKRQFEFIQQTWINNPKFGDLYNDRDPITGNNFDPLNNNADKEFNMTVPTACIRERFTGIPRFVTVKAGGYFFLPSLPALRYLAE